MPGSGRCTRPTPTFLITGWRHDGPWDLTSLLEAVEEAASTTVVGPRRNAIEGAVPKSLTATGITGNKI
jgi:hypothetical protein